jgi:hypothetical protein
VTSFYDKQVKERLDNYKIYKRGEDLNLAADRMETFARAITSKALSFDQTLDADALQDMMLNELRDETQRLGSGGDATFALLLPTSNVVQPLPTLPGCRFLRLVLHRRR